MNRESENPYQSPKTDVSPDEAEKANGHGSPLDDINDEDIKKLNKFSSDINILGTVSVLGALGGAFYITDNFTETATYPVWAVLIFLLFCASSYACFARPAWGRGVGFLVSLILLFGFPIGTIIGFIGIKATLNSERLFGHERITNNELGEAVALIERQTP
jgi:hypothetical protein